MKTPPINSAILRVMATFLVLAGGAHSAEPLVSLDYLVRGQLLEVTPAVLSVPKGIGGSVGVAIAGEVPPGSFVEASLRGPAFPARRIVGSVNAPLLLPPLNLVGDYSLDGIRLVSSSGQVLLEGTPSSVPVHVFDEILVSRVTSRPLSSAELNDRGVIIDDNNFRAVEFEVGFVLDGVTFPVRFPVITPDFGSRTELIPAAELEERLAEIDALNRQLAEQVKLPPALETANPNIDIRPLNLQITAGAGDEDLALKVPPIPALVIIPGNIGFLNQFFSVQIFTENAAPRGSGLSVHDIRAKLVLPTGPDRVAGTYEAPGDDPVRYARLAGGSVVQSSIRVAAAGPDRLPGTSDDIGRIHPGEVAQGEFVVEGLQEGLHVLDIELSAKLDGLAAGTVTVAGRAAGTVLVANPKFSFAFSHPRTIRSGEPYEAFVTVLNTSNTRANQVSVSLNANNISGGLLESNETVELGDIAPGQTATASFRIRAQRSGSISFSNITTSSDSLIGRFRLTTGVDERGVQLSRNTLLMPDFVDELPAEVVAAANRVLGQAIGTLTAPQLPPGVIRVSRSLVSTATSVGGDGQVSTGGGGSMVLQLAEAGQRLRYGEPLSRVLPDLLLDWQGARDFSEGWDQILRETDAGREWREAIMRAIENASSGSASSRLTVAAPDLAGRGESWFLATSPVPGGLRLEKTSQIGADLGKSTFKQTVGYGGVTGAWMVGAEAGLVKWDFIDPPSAGARVSVLRVKPDGSAIELQWPLASMPAGSCASYDFRANDELLRIDDNCDGTVDRTLPAQRADFTENAPAVLFARQDAELVAGRPAKTCYPATTTNEANEAVSFGNYGTVIAVLFNKPMSQESAGNAESYQLDNGISAAAVQVQPGGRVALLTMRNPLGGLVARSLTVSGEVKDSRGQAVAATAVPVASRVVEGIRVRGRVLRADGSPGAGLPVTLTYNDLISTTSGCAEYQYRPGQVISAADGTFAFDFVVGGIPFTLSSTDTTGLSEESARTLLASIRGEKVDLQRAAETSPNAVAALLAELGGSSKGVAIVENIDRALVRDVAQPARQGSEGVYALRFRGRGVVSGRVLAPDGVTPVADAAVNLFPDPASRELGRGVRSDAGGRFLFNGVPLGGFSLEATSQSGLTRVVSGSVAPGSSVTEIEVVLNGTPARLSSLRGRVSEVDGSPHPAAEVYVGTFVQGEFCCVVAKAVADADGFWNAAGIPVGTYDVIALSSDGRRKAQRLGITVIEGAVNTVNLNLQGRTSVVGRVEFPDGRPAVNALVGGGDALVRTDSLGRFTLSGVPTGLSAISAGLERNPDAGISFPRTGSTAIQVTAGAENFALIRFRPIGRIIGQVRDVNGVPVPRTDVAIPMSDGEDISTFIWVDTDANGNYSFEGLSPGSYDLSSPAPPHERPFEERLAGFFSAAGGGDEEEIGAAVGALFGAEHPLLNGEGASFNPSQWGYIEGLKLDLDGQTVVANITYLGKSRINGKVLNGQGVPIGATVRLTGVAPKPNGRPAFRIRGEKLSDPALGTFNFDGINFIGNWGLQAASPFFPQVISQSGRTTQLAPDLNGIVMQFPPVSETNGSLLGRVFNSAGQSAGAGIKVEISFGDLTLRTDAEGRFETTPGTFTLPGNRSYTVTASDESSGATARAVAYVPAGGNGAVNIRLLGRGSATVEVVLGSGGPAAGAEVEMEGVGYPGQVFQGTADSNGRITFSNVFEGDYAVCASLSTPSTRVAGRSSLRVPLGGSANTRVMLAGTATVRGSFVAADRLTPIPFANVSLGLATSQTSAIAVTSTDALGRFELRDIPLGNFRLSAVEDSTGRSGSASLSVALAGETREVRLIESPPGQVTGIVTNSSGSGPAVGAVVTLTLDDQLANPRQRTVTTGPDGSYLFASVPAGGFEVVAVATADNARGSSRGSLPPSGGEARVNIELTPSIRLVVQVREAGGLDPAESATVSVAAAGRATVSADTDAAGEVHFENVFIQSNFGTPSPVLVTAVSTATGQTRSYAIDRRLFTRRGADEVVSLTLRGTGAIGGKVFQGDGSTPAVGAVVTVRIQPLVIPTGVGSVAGLFAGVSETTVTDEAGAYAFSNLPSGQVQLTASANGLSSTASANITANGSTLQNLSLTASGSVIGRIVREDGSTPAGGAEVLITFTRPGGGTGSILAVADADGRFSGAPVPVGNFSVSVSHAASLGLANIGGSLAANGEIIDLGEIVLDESSPFVASVVPGTTASGVPRSQVIELQFSEGLDPAAFFSSGFLLRRLSDGVVIPTTVTLLPLPSEQDRRTVRMTPNSILGNFTSYEILVVSGELKNAFGGITNRGPRDRVGRSLEAPFVAAFTTRDEIVPFLQALAPFFGEENVDTRASLRFTFSEAIQPGAQITLSGPSGAVSGTTSLILGGQVLVFTPTFDLPPNGRFDWSLDGVADLAGNALPGMPRVGFFTSLDTLGPDVIDLVLADGAKPIAGAVVELEAVFAESNFRNRVRISIGNSVVGTSAEFSQRVPVTLPASGTVNFTAVGIDSFGNEGLPFEKSITVRQNLAPVANPDMIAAGRTGARIISIADELLNNDTDPDDPEPLEFLSFTQPEGGELAVGPEFGQLTYLPPTESQPGDSFTYTVRDFNGATSVGLVTVVFGGNEPPVPGDPRNISRRQLAFDGMDDFATLPAALLDGAGKFTVEFWTTKDDSRNGQVLTIEDANGGVILSVRYVASEGSFLQVELFGSSDGIFPNSPEHVAIVVDERAGTGRIYFSGRLERTLNFEPQDPGPGIGAIRLGHASPEPEGFPGQFSIDELRFWRTALTEGDIVSRLNRPLTEDERSLAELAGYFSFENGTGRDLVNEATAGFGAGLLADGDQQPVRIEPGIEFPVLSLVVLEDEESLITLEGFDPDGDALQFILTSPSFFGGEFAEAIPDGSGGFTKGAPIFDRFEIPDGRAQLFFTPQPDFTGEVGFQFAVSDGEFESLPGRATLLVANVNDAPVGSADQFDVTQDQPLTINSVVGNDFDVDSRSDDLRVAEITSPEHGSLARVPDAPRILVYTPLPGYFGPDSFTYRPNDGLVSGDPVTVTINVVESRVIRWKNAVSGSFLTAANWDPAVVPGFHDIALIDQPGDYSISMNTFFGPTISQLKFEAPSGQQRFDIGANRMSFRHGIAGNQNASFSGSNFCLVSVLSGDVTLGRLSIGNRGSFSLASGVTGGGKLTLLGESSSIVGSVQASEIEIGPSAVVFMSNFNSFDSARLSANTILNQGTLQCSGRAFFGGSLTVNQGLIEISVLNSTFSGVMSGEVRNEGRMNFSAGLMGLSGGPLLNQAGATLSFTNGGIDNTFGDKVFEVINRGSVLKSGGSSRFTRVDFSNEGLLELNGGRMEFIDATFANAPAGDLKFVLGDTSGDTTRLSSNGQVEVAGRVSIALVAPFAEPAGVELPLMTYLSRSGDFDSESGFSGNFGYNFSRRFDGTTLRLKVENQGVPAPVLAQVDGWPRWQDEMKARAPEGMALGELEDPDHDGISNLLEYAFGGDPFGGLDSARLPRHVRVLHEGRMAPGIEYWRRSRSVGVRYEAQSSVDLIVWSGVTGGASGLAEIQVVPDPANEDWERVTVVDTSESPPDGLLFRIRITLDP